MAYKKPRLAPRSFHTDALRLVTILQAFGDRIAGDITPQDVDGFLGDLDCSPSTINRYHSLLSSVFAIALRNGRVKANPCEEVEYLRENAGRVRYLKEDEEVTLRAAIRALCPEREPEFDLALNTGMRRGEQFELKRECVDLENRVITVKGKTGQRHIPLNSQARAALERLLAAGSGEFVCAETKKIGQRDWRRWFEAAVKRAGLPRFNYHCLRHTFASRLVMKGVDLRAVQDLMGHKSLNMTLRYSHLSPEHLHSAVERLAPPRT